MQSLGLVQCDTFLAQNVENSPLAMEMLMTSRLLSYKIHKCSWDVTDDQILGFVTISSTFFAKCKFYGFHLKLSYSSPSYIFLFSYSWMKASAKDNINKQ